MSAPWHSRSISETTQELGTTLESGLSTVDVEERRKRHGLNALPDVALHPLWAVFLSQFRSPLIYLLLAAAGVALALGEESDAAVIAIVVLLNSIVGTVQEGRAERSLAALRKLARHTTRVVRDGQQSEIEAIDLVPGDVILLEAGNAVTADARIAEAASLQAAEAALTGESAPTAKGSEPVAADTSLGDRSSMLYSGTFLATGRARAIVVATGMGTEIGRIAELTAKAPDSKTPLEKRIDEFGRHVIYASLATTTLVIAIGVARQIPFAEIFMIAISQMVGMIPEGLPVALTIALAIGVQRMASRKAVVRRLSAVETLGSTSVICSDKTGTLTRNQMTVTSLVLANGDRVGLTGIGYEPIGILTEPTTGQEAAANEPITQLLRAAILCNDAVLNPPASTTGEWQAIGDPTEVAMVVAGRKAGIDAGTLRADYPRIGEIPFDSSTKLMATEHSRGAATFVVVKGAPESVFDLCADVDSSVREAARELASHGLRILAVAIGEELSLANHSSFSSLAGKLRILGLIAELDPPRPEVPLAIQHCRNAGIRPIMITGDHKETALAIARELGMASKGDVAIDGRELEAMSDAQLAERLPHTAVFARVHPEQKLRIVAALQSRGEVVAVTGDGVNDAPALARADVGVAMGITGTEVAKDSAKVVVSDDNFATIVAAVEEGRIAYRNIKKVILLLVSTSFAEVLVLLLALACGYPPPFAAVQILWNNLVTEGLITINLVMEPAEGTELSRPPIAADEPLLTRMMLQRMAVMVPTIAASTFGWFVWRLSQGAPAGVVQTEAFTLLAVCEWFNVLNCRAERGSALNLGILKNHWLVGGLLAGNLLQFAVVFWEPLGSVFRTTAIDLYHVALLGIVGSAVLWAEELRKLLQRRAGRSA